MNWQGQLFDYTSQPITEITFELTKLVANVIFYYTK